MLEFLAILGGTLLTVGVCLLVDRRRRRAKAQWQPEQIKRCETILPKKLL